jgi:peptide-methionine (S)-S-oxide reductase
MEKATFAAGCFWGIESAFRKVDGVASTQVGYTGGAAENPTYTQVCTDRTGHAEAVEVIYDPSRVSYEQLLKLFWQLHDPTQVNKQGPDMGSQYRSAIFFHSDKQRSLAQASKQELEESGKYSRPIATQIVAAGEFYRAEEYHQQYLEKRGLGACSTD